MKFSNYLNSDYIFVDFVANSKEEIITKMCEKISEKSFLISQRKEEIIKGILKREDEISTCMGEGLFIPHVRIKDFNDFIISIAILKNEVEGEIAATHQKDKIKIVFMIISDVLKNKNILKSMSVISKIILRRAKLAEEILLEKNPKNIIDLLSTEDVEIEHRIVAEDVLSPDIEPVSENSTLEEIAKRLILEQRTALPVVSENKDFLGEITEKELISFGMPDHLELMNDVNFLTVGEPFEEYLLKENITKVKEIYRKDVDHLKIDKKTPIMEICFKMVYKNMTRLYVVENGKYCGIINRSDIIKKILHI